ncbi:hypothetical protein SUGI_0375360 [Cryptomeria japonica]|nr:hypothetical protein SUGI_0375360 [Cryptomeria japonica]
MSVPDELPLYSLDSELEDENAHAELQHYFDKASNARMEILEDQVYPYLVSSEQYEEASRMVIQGNKMSSQLGNPIERLCYFLSRALQDRVNARSALNQRSGSR